MTEYKPAAGRSWLTPLYGLGVKIIMPERGFRDRLVDLVSPAPGERILEFGFSTGSNLIALGDRAPEARLSGVDVDPKIYERARAKTARHGTRAELRLYDGEILPYADDSFDVVVSCLVFHHLDANGKESAFTEIRRVLRPGWRLVIRDWGSPASLLMRLASGFIILIDGFETTRENRHGRLPEIAVSTGFDGIREVAVVNTAVGKFRYLTAGSM